MQNIPESHNIGIFWKQLSPEINKVRIIMTYETEFSEKTIIKVSVIAGILFLIKLCGIHPNLYLKYNVYIVLYTLHTVSESIFEIL